MLLIQDLLHADQLDNPPWSFVKSAAFVFRVFGVAEADEEAALAAVVVAPRCIFIPAATL